MITKNTLEVLEFHKLLSLISHFSHSNASQQVILDIQPFEDKDEIDKRYSLISEIRRLSSDGNPLRIAEFPDISSQIEQVRPEGAVLEPFELVGFIIVFTIGLSVSRQFQDTDDIPSLKEFTQNLTGHPDILSILESSIDREGNILDSASFLLSDLRKQIRGLESRIRRRLDEIVRNQEVSKFLQDDFITKRAERWVIPVRMDSKGQVAGVVHDVSKSGETAFVEPLEIISLANKLENLIAEQKAEEIRILKNICSRIRQFADTIAEEFNIIVNLDVLNSIAEFSDTLNMDTPMINDSSVLSLHEAVHPLLSLSLQKSGQRNGVVPLNVHVGDNSTVMVITGPNAGGKTVAIKTIGLIVIMSLSGIPIPADSSSSIPFINNLLVDIGDEQSIESNLSTFSGHISNISEILRNADSRSLVLIDELGSGTDPEEGSAIACAVLTELSNKKALLFSTTHLMGIKGFVQRTPNMVNASMEFDETTLSPLYKLRPGEPGQSHAIEIAKHYGLPDSVISLAKEMLGDANSEFDSLIADLKKQRSEYESSLAELRNHQKETDKKGHELKEKMVQAEDRQREILARTYKEAADIVSATKRQMHALLDEIKKKGKSEGKKVIRKLEEKQQEIALKRKEYSHEDADIPEFDELKSGDTVFVNSLGYDVSIADIDRKHKRLRVKAGSKEIEVPASEVTSKKGISLEIKQKAKYIDKPEEFVSSRLNLIGLRVDEALSKLEQFLNHAMLGGLSEVTIIHGIGEGILSKAVRNFLGDHLLVKTFRSGELSEGGEGVTVVSLL